MKMYKTPRRKCSCGSNLEVSGKMEHGWFTGRCFNCGKKCYSTKEQISEIKLTLKLWLFIKKIKAPDNDED